MTSTQPPTKETFATKDKPKEPVKGMNMGVSEKAPDEKAVDPKFKKISKDPDPI